MWTVCCNILLVEYRLTLMRSSFVLEASSFLAAPLPKIRSGKRGVRSFGRARRGHSDGSEAVEKARCTAILPLFTVGARCRRPRSITRLRARPEVFRKVEQHELGFLVERCHDLDQLLRDRGLGFHGYWTRSSWSSCGLQALLQHALDV